MAGRWNLVKRISLLAILAAGCKAPPAPMPEMADRDLAGEQQETVSNALGAKKESLRVRRENADLWLEYRLSAGVDPDTASFFAREIRAMTTAALMSSTVLTVRCQVRSPEGAILWTLSARRRDLVELAAGRLPGDAFLLRLDWERGAAPPAARRADLEKLTRWAGLCGLPDARVMLTPPSLYLISPDADRPVPVTARLAAYVTWAAGVAERVPEAEEAVIISVRTTTGKDGKKREVPVGRLRIRGKDLRELAAGRLPAGIFLERLDAEDFK